MKNRKIIDKSDYSISDFIERIGVNAPGNPIMGDCLTYSCAYSTIFNGEHIMMIFLPDIDESAEPMHAATKIDSMYFDGRGKFQKNRLIDEQREVLRSDFKHYLRDRGIRNTTEHVKSNTIYVDLNEAKDNVSFNRSLFEKIVETANDELESLSNGENLSPDKTTNREPDF